MKYLVIIVFIAGVFFLFTLEGPEKTSSMVPAPSFRSVVYADDRSVCQKKSEVAISQAWERICEKAGKPSNCELTNEAANTAYIAGNFVIQNCAE